MSVKGIEFRIASNAEERYIAPVSRKEKPRTSATFRAVVLFPDAAGPSIAISLGSQGHILSYMMVAIIYKSKDEVKYRNFA